MNKEDMIRMAQEAQMPFYWRTGEITYLEKLERFAELVASAEHNKLAEWMIQRSYATGHGDSIEDLLKELEWQIRESERKRIIAANASEIEKINAHIKALEVAVLEEREACAKVAKTISDKYAYGYYGNEVDTADEIESAIRARGQE